MSSAAALTAEMGLHPVPSAPGERDASVREVGLCWRPFPYPLERSGKRGYRLTRSDGAWLATLSRLDLPGLLELVGWLRAVLGARGIPLIILQTRLETLRDALVAAVPRCEADYAKLHQAGEDLCDPRRRHISDSQLAALSLGLDESAGVDGCTRLPETLLLLPRAVADEIDGSQGAPANLCGWPTDAERFSADRIAAVKATASQARTDAGASCKTFQI